MKPLYVINLVSLLFITVIHAVPPLDIHPSKVGYRISLSVPEPLLQVENVSTVSSYGEPVNETFVKAYIYGFDYNGEPGEPALLTATLNLAFEGDDPVVEVDSLETETIQLQGKLYPIQPPYYYDGSGKKPTFTYDPEAYKRISFGEPVSIGNIFTYRGQKVVELSIGPISYDPETNTATIIRHMEVSVNMKKPSVVRSLNSRSFDPIMRAMFPNLEGVPSESFDEREKYLIIAEPAYLNNADLKRFIDYRNLQYEVKLVSTADIRDTTREAYREFIYNKEKPTFCLLVGSSFPSWKTYSWHSLNYYVASQVNSSNLRPLPDIALGLFWVTSATQLANIVYKTLATEKSLGSRPKVVHGQGGNTSAMGLLPADHCDKTIEEINNSYFAAGTGFQAYSYPSLPGGAQRAIDRFNLGCAFNIFNGHGSTTGQAYGWGTSNLYAMKNRVYPFVLTCACLTGTFDQNCVAATAVAYPYGPVTYIGANDNSAIGQHVLNQGYPEAIMKRNITKNGLAFVYGVNYDSTPRAIAEYAGQVSSWVKALMGWQYHHFGDPAIETMQEALAPNFIDIEFPVQDALLERETTVTIRWSDNLDGTVRIDLYKGNAFQSTIAASTESDGAYDWFIPATLDTGNDYRIRLSSLENGSVWNTGATFTVVPEYILQPPYYDSFDDLDSGSVTLPMMYSRTYSDDIGWQVGKGPTPSRIGDSADMTGPLGDHTSGQGNYLYVNAWESNPGKTADFITPKFNLTNGAAPSLSFWVHMMSLNNTMGNLVLDICVDGTWHTDVLGIYGNQGPGWQQKVVSLAPYLGRRVNFRFRATTGSTWASDIAIDDVRIEEMVPLAYIAPVTAPKTGITVQGGLIRYAVSQQEATHPVTIGLYDTRGRVVKTLFHGTVSPGNATLSPGSVPAGFYILTLRGNGFAHSATMMVTR